MPTSRRLSKVAIYSVIVTLSIILNRSNLPDDVLGHLLAILDYLKSVVTTIF